MNEFEVKHEEKTKEMKKKYEKVINELSRKFNVDVGVAYNMLQASVRGGSYADGLEFDREELAKDMDELTYYSIQNAIQKGLKT